MSHPWDGPAIVRTPSMVYTTTPPACAGCRGTAKYGTRDGWHWCPACYAAKAEHLRATAGEFDKAIGLDPAPVITATYLTPTTGA